MQEAELKNKKLLYKVLGSIVKKHRKSLDKSVYSIVAACEMSTNSWNRVEKAVSLDPSLTTMWKIAEVLDMRLSDLIREVEDELGDEFSLSGLI